MRILKIYRFLSTSRTTYAQTMRFFTMVMVWLGLSSASALAADGLSEEDRKYTAAWRYKTVCEISGCRDIGGESKNENNGNEGAGFLTTINNHPDDCPDNVIKK